MADAAKTPPPPRRTIRECSQPGSVEASRDFVRSDVLDREVALRVADHAVVGRSNASRATLLHLNAHAGLRWHQAWSAEDAQAYKPAPAIYQLALDTSDCPARSALMVAAHAWDLRGAQSLGMRTAYIQRPVGDPPQPDDTFDLRVDSLKALLALLTRPATLA